MRELRWRIVIRRLRSATIRPVAEKPSEICAGNEFTEEFKYLVSEI